MINLLDFESAWNSLAHADDMQTVLRDDSAAKRGKISSRATRDEAYVWRKRCEGQSGSTDKDKFMSVITLTGG